MDGWMDGLAGCVLVVLVVYNCVDIKAVRK